MEQFILTHPVTLSQDSVFDWYDKITGLLDQIWAPPDEVDPSQTNGLVTLSVSISQTPNMCKRASSVYFLN